MAKLKPAAMAKPAPKARPYFTARAIRRCGSNGRDELRELQTDELSPKEALKQRSSQQIA